MFIFHFVTILFIIYVSFYAEILHAINHFTATRKAKPYLKDSKHQSRLENKYVLIVYNKITQTIICYEKTSPKRIARFDSDFFHIMQQDFDKSVVSGSRLHAYSSYTMSQHFDNLCISFYYGSTYESATRYLNPYFANYSKEVTQEEAVKDEQKCNYFKQITENKSISLKHNEALNLVKCTNKENEEETVFNTESFKDGVHNKNKPEYCINEAKYLIKNGKDYEYIVYFFIKYFEIVQEKLLNTASEDKTDINSASEEEIAKLSGINIVTAKKIVQYREANGGFSSWEDFFKNFKIKEHFKTQLLETAYIGKIEKNEHKSTDSDRIVDL